MVFLEFRMPLPITVNEYQIAQLHMVIQESLSETGGGEGVNVLKNEPYDNTDGSLGKSKRSLTVPRQQLHHHGYDHNVKDIWCAAGKK